MNFKMVRVDVYHTEVKDEVGGVAAALKPLAEAGAHLEYVHSERSSTRAGYGDLFVAPKVGSTLKDIAAGNNLRRVNEPIVMRVEGDDKTGLGGRLTLEWEKAGLNLHGLVMAAVQGRFVGYVTFDTANDANKAATILAELGTK